MKPSVRYVATAYSYEKNDDEKEILHLDEERKAAMVSNLLVVLCGETEAQPVINTGTLYT